MRSANTSDPVRKIDPFSIATSAVSKAQESTAASVNGNPVAGNPGKEGLVGAIKRVTDPLTGGIGGAKRPAP
jgi:hypothetical protein